MNSGRRLQIVAASALLFSASTVHAYTYQNVPKDNGLGQQFGLQSTDAGQCGDVWGLKQTPYAFVCPNGDAPIQMAFGPSVCPPLAAPTPAVWTVQVPAGEDPLSYNTWETTTYQETFFQNNGPGERNPYTLYKPVSGAYQNDPAMHFPQILVNNGYPDPWQFFESNFFTVGAKRWEGTPVDPSDPLSAGQPIWKSWENAGLSLGAQGKIAFQVLSIPKDVADIKYIMITSAGTQQAPYKNSPILTSFQIHGQAVPGIGALSGAVPYLPSTGFNNWPGTSNQLSGGFKNYHARFPQHGTENVEPLWKYSFANMLHETDDGFPKDQTLHINIFDNFFSLDDTSMDPIGIPSFEPHNKEKIMKGWFDFIDGILKFNQPSDIVGEDPFSHWKKVDGLLVSGMSRGACLVMKMVGYYFQHVLPESAKVIIEVNDSVCDPCHGGLIEAELELPAADIIADTIIADTITPYFVEAGVDPQDLLCKYGKELLESTGIASSGDYAGWADGDNYQSTTVNQYTNSAVQNDLISNPLWFKVAPGMAGKSVDMDKFLHKIPRKNLCIFNTVTGDKVGTSSHRGLVDYRTGTGGSATTLDYFAAAILYGYWHPGVVALYFAGGWYTGDSFLYEVSEPVADAGFSKPLMTLSHGASFNWYKQRWVPYNHCITGRSGFQTKVSDNMMSHFTEYCIPNLGFKFSTSSEPAPKTWFQCSKWSKPTECHLFRNSCAQTMECTSWLEITDKSGIANPVSSGAYVVDQAQPQVLGWTIIFTDPVTATAYLPCSMDQCENNGSFKTEGDVGASGIEGASAEYWKHWKITADDDASTSSDAYTADAETRTK